MDQINLKALPNLTDINQSQEMNQFISPTDDIFNRDPFGFQINEDVCFKCKKVGEIYCCDNCFRSYHWKCIGEKKTEQLIKSSYAMNFLCDSCDQQNNCVKCNSIHPKQSFNLLDFSEDSSIFTVYKCTHCYSKIHKKCLDIPLELLNRKLLEKQKLFPKGDTLQNYVCSKCLQNVGITEIITTQRTCNNQGIENLYYFVLLNTNSPIHKGWLEQYALRNHLKKLSGNQTFISQFLKNNKLYQTPEIDKLLAIRFPAKYKKTSISEVLKIIESRSHLSILERYGDPDNFKFLVKWKQRNYTALTWQDETIVIRQCQVLKTFLRQKESECFLINCVNDVQSKKNKSNTNQANYALLEYYFNNDEKITSKFLIKKQEIVLNCGKSSIKPFQDKMTDLDGKNQNDYFEIIAIENDKFNPNKVSQHTKLLVKYLEKCYHSEIVLRPTIIISDNFHNWEESITNFQDKIDSLHLKFIKFEGSKHNTDSMKKWDFFISKKPTLLKAHIILIDYNYFLYENKFLFENISQFFVIIFDRSDRLNDIKERLKFIQKAFIPFKSKVYKEIYLVESSIQNQEKQNFIMSLLNIHSTGKNPIKKCVYHDLSFSKIKQYLHSESNLKLKLEKKYKESAKIINNPSKQILNQGQRLSFLKFIMAFGLNIKKIDDMCNRMRASNPIMWELVEKTKMTEVIKQYLSLFMAVISNNSKQSPTKRYEGNINHFLFNYQRESVLQRIIQLKKLKNEIQKSFDDHSKFVIKKQFMFFSLGQCKPFPLWNTYEDYTLGALIVQQGYQMWGNIMNSKKWVDYHSQLQTRKIYQHDSKTGTFTVQQKIVPIKKKVFRSSVKFEERIIQHISHKIVEESQCQKTKSQDTESGRQETSQTYGEYLLRKIRSSKESKESQYGILNDLNILQGHIAERADSILLNLPHQ